MISAKTSIVQFMKLSRKCKGHRNFVQTATDAKKVYDVVVIGGGIVGCATAREIVTRYPNVKVALIEKENEIARHQSSHNSGVIHAGIYYKPGSLKAKLCVEGMVKMYKYLDEKQIPYKKVGKLIVALNEKEKKGLNDLYERSLINKVPDVRIVEREEIKALEPNVSGVQAIHSPHTGICNYGQVATSYAKDFTSAKGDIYLKYQVCSFVKSDDPCYPVGILSNDGQMIKTKHVLACAGLQSDYIAELSGCSKHPRIVPVRGEYFIIDKSHSGIINGNIYPVPDPKLPFLGVHFSPKLDGSVVVGPNAVIAFKREGYKWTDFNFKEFTELLTNKGLIKMGLKNTKSGILEMMRSTFVFLKRKQLRQYIECIDSVPLKRAPHLYGVRAQAITSDGVMVDDFIFELGKGEIGQFILNCRNAPSPGATSSLSIAEMITDKLNELFSIEIHN